MTVKEQFKEKISIDLENVSICARKNREGNMIKKLFFFLIKKF